MGKMTVGFDLALLGKLDGQGRARREAARRRKSEWKVKVAIQIPLAAMAAGK